MCPGALIVFGVKEGSRSLKWGALEMFINKRRYYMSVVYLRFDHLTNLS